MCDLFGEGIYNADSSPLHILNCSLVNLTCEKKGFLVIGCDHMSYYSEDALFLEKASCLLLMTPKFVIYDIVVGANG